MRKDKLKAMVEEKRVKEAQQGATQAVQALAQQGAALAQVHELAGQQEVGGQAGAAGVAAAPPPRSSPPRLLTCTCADEAAAPGPPGAQPVVPLGAGILQGRRLLIAGGTPALWRAGGRAGAAGAAGARGGGHPARPAGRGAAGGGQAQEREGPDQEVGGRGPGSEGGGAGGGHSCCRCRRRRRRHCLAARCHSVCRRTAAGALTHGPRRSRPLPPPPAGATASRACSWRRSRRASPTQRRARSTTFPRPSRRPRPLCAQQQPRTGAPPPPCCTAPRRCRC
jgi:hypothetical protein